MTKLSSILIGLLAAALVAVAVLSGVARTRQQESATLPDAAQERNLWIWKR